MRKTLSALLLITCLVACKSLVSDYGGYKLEENPEFGDNLILDHSDASSYHIWSDGTKSLVKGANLKFHRNERTDTLFIGKGSIVIESYINNVKHDSLFIIVDQKPLDSIWGAIINKNSAPQREKRFVNSTDAIKCLKNSKIHNYWIISKRTNDVFGPYTFTKFISMKQKLGVAERLTFLID
jgi:hypothetical protein